MLEEDIIDRYLDTVAELAADGPRDLTIVYTPLHGVGGTSVVQVLETAGFSAPQIVAEQEEPDGTFPTVSFPNPEEPGAMDLAMALADKSHADIVVANDPDADRCAAAVTGAHGWRMLRGDEVGALLASHLLKQGKQGVYATSIVSSSLLGRMAAKAGQPYAETLTGFKWIGRVEGLAFGYEEALGYCVDPEHVRDKDGVSALLLLCELAAEAKAEGRTLDDLLDDIATEHGLHATDQVSVRVTDLSEIGRAMERLRAHPAGVARRPRGPAGRRPQRGLRRPAPDRGPALPPRRGRPGDRPPERHRAEDQVLPRGGRPGAPRRRRRGGPDRRRRPAGRAGQRHPQGRRASEDDRLEAHRLVERGDRLLGRGHPPRVGEDLEDLLGVGALEVDRHPAVDWEAQPAEKVSGSLPSIASRSRWVDLIIAVLAAWLTQAKPRPRNVIEVQSL